MYLTEYLAIIPSKLDIHGPLPFFLFFSVFLCCAATFLLLGGVPYSPNHFQVVPGVPLKPLSCICVPGDLPLTP